MSTPAAAAGSASTPANGGGHDHPDTSRTVKEEHEAGPQGSPDTETRTRAESSETPQNAGTAQEQQPRVKKRRLGVDPSLIISEERSKRRRTPTPEAEHDDKDGVHDPKDPARAKELGLQIFKKIMDSKDPDGESMAEPFIKLPNRRQFPDYYETIKHPMSLEQVQQKLDASSYQTLRDVTNDIGQIFNNAKRYNMKDSLIFIWAKKLHKMTRVFYSTVTRPHAVSESEGEGEGEDAEAEAEAEIPFDRAGTSADVGEEDVDMGGPSAASADGDSVAGKVKKRGSYMKDGPTVYKLLKPVLKTIKEAKSRDGTGREIAGIFEELPDRKMFPDYYQAIKRPISLEEIEDKMVGRKYEAWEQFFDDVELMCSNAMEYNEDGSEVFIDAQQIREVLQFHRVEILKRLAQFRPQDKFRVRPAIATPVRLAAGLPTSVPPPQPAIPPSSSAYPYNGTRPSMPMASPTANAFLPALPQGVVTDEVVANLERYPVYEQQAWAATLPPQAIQLYRQMLAANEARKRAAISGVPTVGAVLAGVPSANRPPGTVPLINRHVPPHPTIKFLDFSFSTPGEDPDLRQAIRLHNMRGVVTHAVVVGSETTDIELTAYVNRPETKSGDTVAAIEGVPEVSLRVNGNQGSLPRFVYSGKETERPSGMRWVVTVPSNKMNTKIEVVATKPGALAETSAIYVSRQF